MLTGSFVMMNAMSLHERTKGLSRPLLIFSERRLVIGS